MTDTPAMRPDQLADSAAMLRRLLALVESGELEATTPSARALLRRVEGAALAVELAAGTATDGAKPALRSDGTA